jgi:hypothetical protein
LREWQKEQKYVHSNPVTFSGLSHSVAKSARKFKSEIGRAADKLANISLFAKDRARAEAAAPQPEVPKVTLLYQAKSRKVPFSRLDNDDDDDGVNLDDVYLVPKSAKSVSFADSSCCSYSTLSNSVSSIAETNWPRSVSSLFCRAKLNHIIR